MDTQYYSSSDYFKNQTIGTNRTRRINSDSTTYDPAAPTGGTVTGQFPKTTFMVIPGGVGHITGTVLGAGNAPLEGVLVNVDNRPYSTTTNAQGQFNIANVLPGNYAVAFSKYGYVTQTQNIVLDEDETEVMNITLAQMAMVNVSGTILASDTGLGISGASINLVGYANYNGSSIGNGSFVINNVYANQSYAYSITAAGYSSASGTINVGGTNHAMGNITLNEIAYAPNTVVAAVNGTYSAVDLTWNAPDPTAIEITESFEGTTFPPNDWTQSVTNNGPANTLGVYPTWCRFGSISISGEAVTPTDGSNQAGLWWSYEHQDEWLVTPSFNCPPGAYLKFDSYIHYGSPNEDHYYVKVSTNGGSTWDILWDATAQPEGDNFYAFPITINLNSYSGLQVMLAFHAEDPPSNDGMWYVWFIDNIYIGNMVS
ncbi:MAG TPA: carboxypeptidase regulatory-like domain-containing protein, partial [Candidatus Cloacimonadota bacterium]|nr:carboxypeptidase regulatory-like domain-containing protein [Candidatus Cloacimonadota bacterium]